jgi:hypothetical protein
MRTDEIQSVPADIFKRIEFAFWRWLRLDFGPIGLGVSFVIFAAAAVLFLRSGLFVSGVMLNDTLIYTESGYRIAHGQLPGRDFTIGLGVLWYLPLAIIFQVTGDLAQSIPIAFVGIGGVVFGFATYIAWTRLGLIVGSLVVMFCSILVMAPWAIGVELSPHGSTHTTAAMGYNRVGFTLVLLASLLAVPPKRTCRYIASRWDSLFAVAIFGCAFYIKMPFGFGVAGMVLLWAWFFTNKNRHLLIFVIGSAVIVILVAVFVPGLNSGYLHEMFLHMNINETVGARAIARVISQSAPETIVVAGLPVLALITQGSMNLRRLTFFASLVAGSIILVTQSAQDPYLVAPFAIPVIVLTKLTFDRDTSPEKMAIWATVVALLFGFSTYFFPASKAIVRHAWFAGQSVPIENMSHNYVSLRVPPEVKLRPLDEAFNNGIDGAQAYAAARATTPTNTINPLFDIEYAHTLTDLPNAQALCGRAGDRTSILDIINASSSLLGHRPVGGYVYAHFGRNLNELFHWPDGKMFAGIDCLFDPKLPYDSTSRNGLWLVYGAAITSKFTHVGETRFWRVLVRNDTQ